MRFRLLNSATIDELSLLLHKKLKVKAATATQIADLLKKTEQSQRVLEEVTEGSSTPPSSTRSKGGMPVLRDCITPCPPHHFANDL